MSSNPINLWVMQAPGQRTDHSVVGELLFVRCHADTNAPKGLRITLRPLLNQDFLAHHGNLHWVTLHADINNMKVERRTYGRIIIDLNQRSLRSGAPQFASPTQEVEWNWCLLPEDLERIERDRSDTKSSPLDFAVTAEGIVQSEGGTYLVGGEGHLEIALSDWELYLTAFGYNVPPSTAGLAGVAAVDHPSWREAIARLAPAYTQLRAGEGRAALLTCLNQFERLVMAPYDKNSWKGRYDFPGQKEDGLVTMLAGHCSYLNRVGYHRSKADRDDQGGLIEMPVDQWEAELAVGASVFWLAYALRAPLKVAKDRQST